MKEKIETEKAPVAIGPYSQGIRSGNMIFTSGQLPVDPATGTMPADVKNQTRYSLKNLKAVLEKAGYSIDDIVKVLVFIADMKDFADVNEVYSSFFKAPYPARSCIQAAGLPKDALVEIEAIAMKN